MAPQQLLERFRQLQAARENGSLSPEAYQQAWQDLRQQDDQGTWWSVDPTTGGLLQYDQAKAIWRPPGISGGEPPPGAPLPAPGTGPSPVTTSQESTPQRTTTSPSSARTKILGFVMGWAVFMGGLVISEGGWTILGTIPQTTRSLVPQGTCHQGLYPGEMFFCAAWAAALTLLGSFLTMLVLFLLRLPLTRLATSLVRPLSPRLRAFILSILAALFFTMVWSGSHPNPRAFGQIGLVQQSHFAGLVALFTYITFTCHQGLQQSLAGFFARRDQVSRWRRLAVAMAVPFVLSLLLRRGYAPALGEQIVVLVSLFLGFLLFTPRSGAPAGLGPSPGQDTKPSN